MCVVGVEKRETLVELHISHVVHKGWQLVTCPVPAGPAGQGHPGNIYHSQPGCAMGPELMSNGACAIRGYR